jgi:hypothetical protein
MKRYLRHDTETRELRLVFVDLDRSQDGTFHRLWEWRILSTRWVGGTSKEVVRDRAEWDGKEVFRDSLGNHYIRSDLGNDIYFTTEDQAIVSERTLCPAALSKSGRKRCDFCRAHGWQAVPQKKGA